MKELASMMREFHSIHPGVSYNVYTTNTNGIKEGIEKGTIDIALMTEPVDTSRFDAIHLSGKERWGAIVRQDSELAGRHSVSPEDLINKATNANAIDILSEKYAAANLKWQNAMDEMGKVILGEYYGDIDYNINVNFMKNTVDIDLDGDNPDYHSILEQMSHSDVYSLVYPISQK